jgi:hypothetical protein
VCGGTRPRELWGIRRRPDSVDLEGPTEECRSLGSLDPNDDMTLVSESCRRPDRAGLPPDLLGDGTLGGERVSPTHRGSGRRLYMDIERHRARKNHALRAKRVHSPGSNTDRVRHYPSLVPCFTVPGRRDWGAEDERTARCRTEGSLCYVTDRPVIESQGAELEAIVGRSLRRVAPPDEGALAQPSERRVCIGAASGRSVRTYLGSCQRPIS